MIVPVAPEHTLATLISTAQTPWRIRLGDWCAVAQVTKHSLPEVLIFERPKATAALAPSRCTSSHQSLCSHSWFGYPSARICSTTCPGLNDSAVICATTNCSPGCNIYPRILSRFCCTASRKPFMSTIFSFSGSVVLPLISPVIIP